MLAQWLRRGTVSDHVYWGGVLVPAGTTALELARARLAQVLADDAREADSCPGTGAGGGGGGGRGGGGDNGGGNGGGDGAGGCAAGAAGGDGADRRALNDVHGQVVASDDEHDDDDDSEVAQAPPPVVNRDASDLRAIVDVLQGAARCCARFD